MKILLVILVVGACLGAVGCASGARIAELRGDLDGIDPRFEAVDPSAERSKPRFDGQLTGYVDHAIQESPALQARYASWRAAVEKIAASDKLPEPTVTYGVFLQRVETRVGSQRQKVGVRFALPWPSKLDASADAATLEARAAGHLFDAERLAVERRVSDAWWSLWAIHQDRAILLDQRALLLQLAASIRGRLEVGRATVADLSQIELSVSRLTDQIESLDEAQHEAEARLLSASGAPLDTDAPIELDGFVPARPTEDLAVLRAQARNHPQGQSLIQRAEAQRARAQRAEADRYPDLLFGVDYIDTAEIEGVDLEDNGKDPVVASIGIKLPIWGGAYSAVEASARAQGRALEHQQASVADALESQVVQAVSRIRDTNRKLKLYDDTLIPQAETTFGSAIGAYEAGGGSVAAILLAYRDFNAIRLDRVRAQVRHAMAWSWLHSTVGRPVASEAIP